MKKMWFPKIVCICVCVCASLFLFTLSSIGYYTPTGGDLGYYKIPGTDMYASLWGGPSPYEYGFPYNMGPAYDFYNYQLQHPYNTYLYQQSYNIYGYGYPNSGFSGWNMPYNYGWNMPNNYGYGTPYGGYSNLGYPYGGYSIYGQPLPDYGSSPFGNYGFNTGYYNYGPGYGYGQPSYNYGWNQPNYNPYGYGIYGGFGSPGSVWEDGWIWTGAGFAPVKGSPIDTSRYIWIDDTHGYDPITGAMLIS